MEVLFDHGATLCGWDRVQIEQIADLDLNRSVEWILNAGGIALWTIRLTLLDFREEPEVFEGSKCCLQLSRVDGHFRWRFEVDR